MSQTPSAPSTMTGAIAAILSGVHTSLPGRVEAYDSATGRADVSPLVGHAFLDEDGERQVEAYPVIPGVPVIMPGSGGRRIKYPVAVGDTVLLMFAEGSIDRWKSKGGVVTDTGDDRRFHLSDAVAISGLMDFATAADASPAIEFTDAGKIQLGTGTFVPTGPTSDQLVKASAIDPFTGQTQAVLNPTNLTTTELAK